MRDEPRVAAQDVDEFAIARERYENLIPRIAQPSADHFQVWRARQNLALVLGISPSTTPRKRS